MELGLQILIVDNGGVHWSVKTFQNFSLTDIPSLLKDLQLISDFDLEHKVLKFWCSLMKIVQYLWLPYYTRWMFAEVEMDDNLQLFEVVHGFVYNGLNDIVISVVC